MIPWLLMLSPDCRSGEDQSVSLKGWHPPLPSCRGGDGLSEDDDSASHGFPENRDRHIRMALPDDLTDEGQVRDHLVLAVPSSRILCGSKAALVISIESDL